MDTSKGIMGSTWAGGRMPGPVNPQFAAFSGSQYGLRNRSPEQLQAQAEANGFGPGQGEGMPMPRRPMQQMPMRGPSMMMPAPQQRTKILGAQASPSFGAADTRMQAPAGVKPSAFRRLASTPEFAAQAYQQQQQQAAHQQSRGEMLMDKEQEKAAREKDKLLQTEASMAGYQSFLDGFKKDGHLSDADLETLNHAKDPAAKLAVMQALTKQGEDRRNRSQQEADQANREKAMTTPIPINLGSGQQGTMIGRQFIPAPKQAPAPYQMTQQDMETYKRLGQVPYREPGTGAMKLGNLPAPAQPEQPRNPLVRERRVPGKIGQPDTVDYVQFDPKTQTWGPMPMTEGTATKNDWKSWANQ